MIYEAGSDNCFRPSVRPSPLFKCRKTKQQKTMFATGVTMGLAEWIIDDTCLVFVIQWSLFSFEAKWFLVDTRRTRVILFYFVIFKSIL